MVTWTTLCRVLLVVEGEIPAGEKRQFNSTTTVVAVAPGPAAPDTFLTGQLVSVYFHSARSSPHSHLVILSEDNSEYLRDISSNVPG